MRRRERKSGGARARIMRGSVLSHKQSIKQNLRIRGQELQETKTKTNSARAGITHQHMERKWIAARVSKKHLKIKIKTEVQTGNLEMKDYEETYLAVPLRKSSKLHRITILQILLSQERQWHDGGKRRWSNLKEEWGVVASQGWRNLPLFKSDRGERRKRKSWQPSVKTMIFVNYGKEMYALWKLLWGVCS